MENETDFVAMTQNSFLEATLDEKTKGWTVTQVITQRRKLEKDSEWEEKEVTITAISRDIDTAMAQVFLSMEGFLITRNHDLFSEPEEVTAESEDGTVVL